MDPERLNLAIPSYRQAEDGSTFEFCNTINYGKLKWTVYHRFSDYLSLYDRLCHSTGLEAIPRPPPKSMGRPSNAAILDDRRQTLEIWIKALRSRADIRTSDPFVQFIEFELHTNSSVIALAPRLESVVQDNRFQLSDMQWNKETQTLYASYEESASMSRLGRVWSLVEKDEIGALSVYSLHLGSTHQTGAAAGAAADRSSKTYSSDRGASAAPSGADNDSTPTDCRFTPLLHSNIEHRCRCLYFHEATDRIFAGLDTGSVIVYHQATGASRSGLPTNSSSNNNSSNFNVGNVGEYYDSYYDSYEPCNSDIQSFRNDSVNSNYYYSTDSTAAAAAAPTATTTRTARTLPANNTSSLVSSSSSSSTAAAAAATRASREAAADESVNDVFYGLRKEEQLNLHAESVMSIRGARGGPGRILTVGFDKAVRVVNCTTLETLSGGKLSKRLAAGHYLTMGILEDAATDRDLGQTRMYIGTSNGVVFVFLSTVNPPEWLYTIEPAAAGGGGGGGDSQNCNYPVTAMELAGSNLLVGRKYSMTIYRIVETPTTTNNIMTSDRSSLSSNMNNSKQLSISAVVTYTPSLQSGRTIHSIAIARTAPLLFLGHTRSISVWDVNKGAEVCIFKSHNNGVRRLFVYEEEAASAASVNKHHRHHHHQTTAAAAAYVKPVRSIQLITGSGDGAIRLWRIENVDDLKHWSSSNTAAAAAVAAGGGEATQKQPSTMPRAAQGIDRLPCSSHQNYDPNKKQDDIQPIERSVSDDNNNSYYKNSHLAEARTADDRMAGESAVPLPLLPPDAADDNNGLNARQRNRTYQQQLQNRQGKQQKQHQQQQQQQQQQHQQQQQKQQQQKQQKQQGCQKRGGILVPPPTLSALRGEVPKESLAVTVVDSSSTNYYDDFIDSQFTQIKAHRH